MNFTNSPYFFRTLLPRSMITTSTTLHVHHVAMRQGVHHDDGQQRMFLQLVNAITEDLARDRQERTESVGYFSRMRSKGSRFTLGVWGLRVCSLDVASASATLRNRSQPSATVRNRSRDPRMAVPMGSSAEVVLFGVCRRVVASFRVAGVALRDIQTCSGTCRKSLRGRRNTFVTLSEDVLQFSWQAQHFGRVYRHFSWQAQHFRRVLLRVFCKSHWQGCVKWWQGANSVAVVAFCVMCWKLTEASHETSILRLQIFRF